MKHIRTSLASFMILILMSVFWNDDALGDVYTYKDASGNTHYVDDPSKIPQEFRQKVIKPHELADIQREESSSKPRKGDWQVEAHKPSFDDYSDIDLSSPPAESKNDMPNIDGNEALTSDKAELVEKMINFFSSKTGRIILIVFAILILAQIISIWILLDRADMPGWGIIIPIYNFVLLSRLGGFSGWWILWMFVPMVGAIIWSCSVYYGIARNFGRGGLFSFATAMLPMFFIPVIAFSDR